MNNLSYELSHLDLSLSDLRISRSVRYKALKVIDASESVVQLRYMIKLALIDELEMTSIDELEIL